MKYDRNRLSWITSFAKRFPQEKYDYDCANKSGLTAVVDVLEDQGSNIIVAFGFKLYYDGDRKEVFGTEVTPMNHSCASDHYGEWQIQNS